MNARAELSGDGWCGFLLAVVVLVTRSLYVPAIAVCCVLIKRVCLLFKISVVLTAVFPGPSSPAVVMRLTGCVSHAGYDGSVPIVGSCLRCTGLCRRVVQTSRFIRFSGVLYSGFMSSVAIASVRPGRWVGRDRVHGSTFCGRSLPIHICG